MSGTWVMGTVLVLRHAGMPFDWFESLGGDEALDAAADRLLQDVADDDTTASEARAAYLAEFERAYARLEPHLHALARDPRVREAVLVSNPGMHDGMWASYVRAARRPRNARWRRVQRQVYTYLQRFCAKNETTSFFGPIGYGHVEDGDHVRLDRGRPTVRAVFVAPWAVRALEGAMLRDRALLAHLPVVRVGSATPDGLGRDEIRVLTALGASPRTVERCAADAGLAVAKALTVLVALARRSLVVVGPRVAEHHSGMFQALLAEVRGLPDVEAADRWQRDLGRLEAARAGLERAGYAQRAERLARVEEIFGELTGRPARRHAGEIYADRLVVYEEASSPFRLAIGRVAADRLAARAHDALELSAAYGAFVQGRQRRDVLDTLEGRFHDSFAAYAERTRPPDVERGRFEQLPAPPDGFVDEPPAVHGPRYALPDICLAARSVEDLASGDYGLVVARVHHHLLVDSWLGTFHDGDRPFDADAAGWLRRSGERLVGLDVSRRNKGFYRFPGPRVRLRPPALDDGADPSLRQPEELTVAAGDGLLRLLDTDGTPAALYLPLADQATYAPFAALSHPQVLHARIGGGRDRTGRVRVGEAVYQRERWQLDVAGLDALDPAARYLALRRLATVHHLPRFVFARTARERKPYCLDTRSPFAAELLAHLTKDEPTLTLEEMLPGPEHLWLTDAEGNRYTCEIRVQFVREPR